MSKTKEDILRTKTIQLTPHWDVIKEAMDEYAAQAVSEYKEKLKGMIHGRSVIIPQQVIQLIDEV